MWQMQYKIKKRTLTGPCRFQETGLLNKDFCAILIDIWLFLVDENHKNP
jgi:hypothetical protein